MGRCGCNNTCACVVTAQEDSGISVTGAGTAGNPYVVGTSAPAEALERLTVFYSIPVASMPDPAGEYDLQQADWTALVDDGGDAISIGPSGSYDGVYVFEPGIYAVNAYLSVPGVYDADNTMMLHAIANPTEWNNLVTATWHGDEAITGSTPWTSGSATNRFPGSGLSGGIYVTVQYKNLHVDTTFVNINLEVVRLTR